eukprot:gene4783-5836_t
MSFTDFGALFAAARDAVLDGDADRVDNLTTPILSVRWWR